ncbi:MAG: L-rhamnose mutarotase [Ginsengibacter sp.]
MKFRRYCFALDLKPDAVTIAEYGIIHERVWPEIIKSIKDAGITGMEIYLIENRLFMIMEVDETFSFERKRSIDEGNPSVQEWEKLMWKYQQALPFAGPGEKWILMDRIFNYKC